MQNQTVTPYDGNEQGFTDSSVKSQFNPWDFSEYLISEDIEKCSDKDPEPVSTNA